MTRLRLLLEYDGTDFQGWQLQPDVRSVQGELERALLEVTGEGIRVHGSGRTDAGVHARGQVAHIDCGASFAPDELERALNATLARDVAVREVEEVAADFDARRDVISKHYVYRILHGLTPSPLRQRYVWGIRGPLDLAAMCAAADLLKGTHDFSAFRGAHGGAPPDADPRRTLDLLEVREERNEVRIHARARSFLRYMVRNLVGTLVDIGLGRERAERVPAILASRDRARAGPTAPPQGLRLEQVCY